MELNDLPADCLYCIFHFVADSLYPLVLTLLPAPYDPEPWALKSTRNQRVLMTISFVSAHARAFIRLLNLARVCRHYEQLLASKWLRLREHMWHLALAIHPRRLPRIVESVPEPRYHQVAMVLYFLAPGHGSNPYSYRYPAGSIGYFDWNSEMPRMWRVTFALRGEMKQLQGPALRAQSPKKKVKQNKGKSVSLALDQA